ncbi:hypothetical protein IFR05_016103 [Cadophora sp. M221]|nr:hypothetical protein IFR05_016103 [Cadophora sp. M221]
MKPAFGATIMHLKPDPKYATVKPYFLDYEPLEDTPKSNTVLDPITNIPIYDIRGRQTDFTIVTNGICLMNLDTGMEHDEYYDDTKVCEIFLKNAAAAAKQQLGASRVQIFDYGPSSVAHIDTSEAYAEEVLWKLNPEEAPTIKKHKWQWFE